MDEKHLATKHADKNKTLSVSKDFCMMRPSTFFQPIPISGGH
jgi:hypothetical protein